jgi:Zn finger protein HypA/HybF involved in hydrogenase expression
MDRRVSAIIIVLGVIAFGVVGCRLFSKLNKHRIESKQKTAFDQGLVAREVRCDNCGVVSPMDVAYVDRRHFQKCPACGAEAARPIVYYVCGNPDCNRQLIKVANHVWGPDGFSPGDPIVCPKCGQARNVEPRELHLDEAERIAQETGRKLP